MAEIQAVQKDTEREARNAPRPQTPLDEFITEFKDRLREGRFSVLPRVDPAPPRGGPQYDPEKVFDIFPYFKKVVEVPNKLDLLCMSEMPVRDKNTYFQHNIAYYRLKGQGKGTMGLLNPVPALASNVQPMPALPREVPIRQKTLLTYFKPSRLFKMMRPPP